jgi:excinuclease ABC subunit C
LVDETRAIEVTVTNTEAEALLLENQLIKRHLPRYNVLLRDDKSYPFIYLSAGEFPRVAFHRGPQRQEGRYFGPFASAGAVRETLNLLQKLFRVRQCEDSFFRNRTRPCLQHQIGRCSAPCTGLTDARGYAEEVHHAELFLLGKSGELIDTLVQNMEFAAQRLEFERAGHYRDQIAEIQKVQSRQYVSGRGGDLDVVACATRGGSACVQVLFFRDGNSLGNKAFYPKLPSELEPQAVLGAFLSQYYLERSPPAELILSHTPDEEGLIRDAWEKRHGLRVQMKTRVRGSRAGLLELAATNAEQALNSRMSSRSGLRKRFEALQDVLGLADVPERLECFDVSHTMGEATVASCVVFDLDGPRKSDYRRFNIKDVKGGDDYAAMHQALTRRYTRLRRGEERLPDILFIDGGIGQLRQAVDVFEELQVEGVVLVGVSKGSARRPGEEILHLVSGENPVQLGPGSPALHLIQQVRDEAHRFAITAHRQRRERRRGTSVLETIPGVGSKRRQTLLKRFGGLRQLARASVEDISAAPGVSQALAQKIYDAFHDHG